MLRNFPQAVLRCGDHYLDLSKPLVMGILNITPDSFYAPSRVVNSQQIADLAGQMISEGARILDIGGMSTRPGATEIPETEELDRILPAMEVLTSHFSGTIISIDTYRSKIAAAAIRAGAGLINDITGGSYDPAMVDIARSMHVPYIAMHMKGTPADMQQYADYGDVIGEISRYFAEKITWLKANGVHDIILDPGFGFAKLPQHNYELIRRLNAFQFFKIPLLIGVSRKSTLSKTIGRPVDETLAATTALHMCALQNGASILRAHDVQAASDTIKVFLELTDQNTLINKNVRL